MLQTILQWTIRGLAVIAALMTTIQPVLGSFSFFRSAGPVNYEMLHLVVGGLLYNVVLLLAVLTLFARVHRRWLLFIICLAQYAAVHLQLRLGLEANQDVGLLAYHIPVGVLIFFLSYLTVTLAFGRRLAPSLAKPVENLTP